MKFCDLSVKQRRKCYRLVWNLMLPITNKAEIGGRVSDSTTLYTKPNSVCATNC